MDDIRYWFYKHSEKISWFIIGFMTFQGLEQIARGNFSGAAWSFALVALNVFLSKR